MTVDRQTVASALTRILGEDGVLSSPSDLHAYDKAARYSGGAAALVLRPRTTKEVSQAVAYAVSHGLCLIPQGGNTGLVGGSTADASGEQIVLSLERMSALTVDAVNRSVRAQAGARLSAVNRALEPQALFLPIDLGADPSVGGMAATNAAGARYIRYGDMRRQVLGLQAVLGDSRGTIVELRRGLRKDNTGLDLRQLFIGSGGALGVITEVEFEVHARPRQAAAALVVLDGFEPALALLRHLEEHAGEMLAAFEGMSRNAVTAALEHVPGLRDPFSSTKAGFVVLIEVCTATPSAALDLPALLQGWLGALIETGLDGVLDILVGAPERMWALRHALSEGLRAKGRVIGFDLAFRRSDLAGFRRAALRRLSREFAEFAVCDFGHIGDGGLHFNLVCGGELEVPPVRVKALRDCVYALADEFGGSFSGEHGIGRENWAYYRSLTPANVQDLAGRVQTAIAEGPIGAVQFLCEPQTTRHS